MLVRAVPFSLLGIARYLWNDSLGGSGPNATLSFQAPPSGAVELGVRVWDLLNDSASANATVVVGSAPSIGLSSGAPETDVGRPIPIRFDVAGSFPPFLLDWQMLPGGEGNLTSLPHAMGTEFLAEASGPGVAWIRAAVTDRSGVTTVVEAPVAYVAPSPQFVFTADEGTVDAGSLAQGSGYVLGGTPPYLWTASTSLPATDVGGMRGGAAAGGSIDWSGRFLGSGNASLGVSVVDGAGVPMNATVRFVVLPPLALRLVPISANVSSGGGLDLALDLSGGLPPYDYRLSLSDGESVVSTLLSPGPFRWTAHPLSEGFLEITFSASDALGGGSSTALTVAVGTAAPSAPPALGGPSAPPATRTPAPPTSAPASAVGAVVAGLVLAATVGFWLWRRWQRRSPVAPPPDPSRQAIATLERLLDESEGIERERLRGLAEEEGVPADSFGPALARLRSSGRVRSTTDPEGRELLFRTDDPPPASDPEVPA
ncbi:MAG TPA: hypothetical protein VGV64_05510 [Thermoplasmata archaeon]|nr:hypothetical protein [Thermoplasmata archaeon]